MNTIRWGLFALSIIIYLVAGVKSIKQFFREQIYQSQTWTFIGFCAAVMGADGNLIYNGKVPV